MDGVPSHAQPYQVVGHLGDVDFKLHSNLTDLSLRLPRKEDVPHILDILQNKANSEYDKSISDASVDELQGVARKWTTLSHPQLTYLNFLIWHPTHQDGPIGIVGLGWIGPVNENLNQTESANTSQAGAAGVMIQPFARGKGYAYEALQMVFDYGLRELGLVEIHVSSHSENTPMKRLMEQKFGLKAERNNNDHQGRVDEFGNDHLWIITAEKLPSFSNHTSSF